MNWEKVEQALVVFAALAIHWAVEAIKELIEKEDTDV